MSRDRTNRMPKAGAFFLLVVALASNLVATGATTRKAAPGTAPTATPSSSGGLLS